MQQMEVKPPAAAARAPVSMVSACSMPGSRRCTCMSMKPAATTRPDASSTSAPASSRPTPIPAIRPSSSARSATASNPDAGSIMRPFLIRSLLTFLGLITDNPFEHRHTHGDAVLHLVQNHRALRIGDLGGKLAPPVDRPGVHHDHFLFGQMDMVQPKPVELKILARRERRLVLPLELHAQHHDNVGVAERVANVVGEGHPGS